MDLIQSKLRDVYLKYLAAALGSVVDMPIVPAARGKGYIKNRNLPGRYGG